MMQRSFVAPAQMMASVRTTTVNTAKRTIFSTLRHNGSIFWSNNPARQSTVTPFPVSAINFTRPLSTVGMDVEEIWKTSDAVCFDVDSTVCCEEGIDVLAAHLGVGKEVANLTKNAMEGNLSYRDSLAARLELMKPSKSSVDKCIEEHPGQLSPGMSELVVKLHEKGKKVFLVSGGFKQLILPIAARLNIPADNVYANVLLFDGDEYAGFDETQPTSKTGGKALVVQTLMEKYGLKRVIMVGDGATDMEARPPAAAFIGYGGVAVRASVKAGADLFVTDFQQLIAAL